MMKFQDLGLSAPLLRAIEEKGYETPTPIQEQAIPPVLRGRDLQRCAQTGTGKTAAFTLPILQLLAEEPPVRGRREIRALVLTPTRELAIQIDEYCRDYARHTPIRHCVIFGGVNQRPQVEALQQGVDLLVATPGRLLDLIGQGYITLDRLRFFVLDEADRMLDMGFIHDIRRILPLLPPKRQSLFFSATMPADIAELAARILHDPVLVSVTPPASVVETIAQRVHFAEKSEKSSLLIDLLRTSEARQVLVFTRTKHGADRLARILNKAGIEAAAIHGNKSQNARVRAMNDFKSGACRVLIATDIAARGIDIDQLPLVINYELPEVAETYVHRIGRTGRAGRDGSAWSFCSEAELEYLLDIQRLTGVTIPVEGEVPEYAARALAEAERKQAGKSGRRATPKPAAQSAPAPKKEKSGEAGKAEKTGIMEMPGKPEKPERAEEPEDPETPETPEAPENSDEETAPKKRRRKRRRGPKAPEGNAVAAGTAATDGTAAAVPVTEAEPAAAATATAAVAGREPAARPEAAASQSTAANPAEPQSTAANPAANPAAESGDKPRKRRRRKKNAPDTDPAGKAPAAAGSAAGEMPGTTVPAKKEVSAPESATKAASPAPENTTEAAPRRKTATPDAGNSPASAAGNTPEAALRQNRKKSRTRNTPRLEYVDNEPKTGIERARDRQVPDREHEESKPQKQIPHTNDWKKRVKSLLLRSFRK